MGSIEKMILSVIWMMFCGVIMMPCFPIGVVMAFAGCIYIDHLEQKHRKGK